jgi:hypothetical protein
MGSSEQVQLDVHSVKSHLTVISLPIGHTRSYSPKHCCSYSPLYSSAVVYFNWQVRQSCEMRPEIDLIGDYASPRSPVQQGIQHGWRCIHFSYPESILFPSYLLRLPEIFHPRRHCIAYMPKRLAVPAWCRNYSRMQKVDEQALQYHIRRPQSHEMCLIRQLSLSRLIQVRSGFRTSSSEGSSGSAPEGRARYHTIWTWTWLLSFSPLYSRERGSKRRRLLLPTKIVINPHELDQILSNVATGLAGESISFNPGITYMMMHPVSPYPSILTIVTCHQLFPGTARWRNPSLCSVGHPRPPITRSMHHPSSRE